MEGETTLFSGELTGDAHPGGAVYVRVAVERGIERLGADATLTYEAGGEAPVVGERVEVPLGKRGRLAPGIVVEVGGAELAGGLSAAKIKPIGRRTGAVLPRSLLDLAAWIGEYYVCPLGMVLAGMMPAAVKAGTGRRRVEMVSKGQGLREGVELKPAARRAAEAIGAIDDSLFPMSLKELAGRAGVRGVAVLRRLAVAGVLEIVQANEIRAGSIHDNASVEGGRTEGLTLTGAQAEVVDGVTASLGEFAVHLLRGVTGSGKTEVYLKVIERTLRTEGSVIVLVPEIALTPQTAGRFTRRFGAERVAVLHSGLTASQRHREWARAAGGEARVVVGARSAIFAPVPRLALVVVDEEHEGSYKQDRLPRYHARDVAVKRAQSAGCPVVLGSATPSLESWKNASEGRYRLWTLAERVGGGELPRTRIVDMREERRARASMGLDDGRIHVIGPTLERAIGSTLREGGQVVLLLNRRGFASLVSCRSAACGYVCRCDQCDANLVIHRGGTLPVGGVVRCHHCDSEQRVPSSCPWCAGRINAWGGGTQRAEEELAAKFAGLIDERSMLRLDSDTMTSAGHYHDALSRFASGEVRLLLGTQMIAKGLDYPNVRLVGVLDADTALHIPDFRAGERTFQLVTQVAGRAGRGAHPGLVIIQTSSPEASPIVRAAAYEFERFAGEELAARARCGWPPATRMARVVCRDTDEKKARESAGSLAEHLAGAPDVRVRGPLPCAVSRIAGFYRYSVDVVGPRAGSVQRALHIARRSGLLKSDARTAVDVDPVALL